MSLSARNYVHNLKHMFCSKRSK